jgi:hypothetical protein
MGEIKRTGPPKARDVKGKIVTWVVPLNTMPDKQWRLFFGQTRDRTVVCSPDRVSMFQGMMVFESAEGDVPTWMSFIDKWMGVANGRYAEWDAARRQREGDVDARDHEQKLSDLNEKFKNL